MNYPEHTLVRELGRGAAGVCVLFQSNKTGELFAVKMMHRGRQITDTVANVEREIKNHILLSGHEGVVQFKEVFLTPHYLGIAMEYAAGGELFDRVVSHPSGRFGEDVARYFFQQLVAGMAWCHSKGICHRDLKLDNVLLSKPIPDTGLQHLSSLMTLRPRLKICDFGYSKSSELDSNPNSLVGTPAYIAPEVFNQDTYSGEMADVWSAGVTLYVMLVGQYPFEDPKDPKNPVKRMKLICSGTYSIPTHVRLSPECTDLLARIFVVDPTQRITLAQIMQHPWVLSNLPPELQTNQPGRPLYSVTQTDEEINKIILAACREG